MKKKLEADLISIAHRILKLRNKSDINQLYIETQKLYEKLTVLKFVEENFDTLKPTIGQNEITAEIETIFNKEETAIPEIQKAEAPTVEKITAPEESYKPDTEETPVKTPEITESVTEEKTEPIAAEINEPSAEITDEPIADEIPEIIIEETPEPIAETAETSEPATEEPEQIIAASEPETVKETAKQEEPQNAQEELSFTTISDLKPIPGFKPAFELDQEAITEEIKEELKPEIKASPIPIAFEDFGINYADAQFVAVDDSKPLSASSVNDPIETKTFETPAAPKESKAVSLNEKLSRGFHIDLNDRIAFTKNLFGNSTEDYSRVLNQLLTFDSFAEVKEFIETMVKPDYNNWEGKDEYVDRFLGIIEKKFL